MIKTKPIVPMMEEQKSKEEEFPLYNKRMREAGIIMEYEQLTKSCPSGVYVVPSAANLRLWQGVVFVRTGLFRGGVFKFNISIPSKYPQSSPSVFFTSFLFHPLIDSHTGQLDISPQFPVWKPSVDYLVHVLRFIKQIFYKTELWNMSSKRSVNTEALEMYQNSTKSFVKESRECVELSIKQLYENGDNTLRFVPEKPEHICIQEKIFQKDVAPPSSPQKEKVSSSRNYSEVFSRGIKRL